MEKEFKGNSAFISKYKTEFSNLKTDLINKLIEDLRSGLSDDDIAADTSIQLRNDNCKCKHSCIIKALAPSSVSLIEEKNSPNECFSGEYFVQIEEHKQKLLALYDLDDKEYHIKDVIKNLIIEDFRNLLETQQHSDVIFELEDVKFYCHKCILLSRCQYFAMMLSGNWVENETSVIVLEGMSSKTFQFILRFIYTAEIEIPSDLNLTELILVEDMYDIKGLSSVIHLHIRAHYLHFYHTPCQFCIAGSIKIYNILSKLDFKNYNEIVEKIYDWYIKGYCKIFNNRSFSKASKQLCENAILKVKESVNSLNIIAHFKDCSKLKPSLPNVQWGIKMKVYVEDLESYLMKYATDNFAEVTLLPGFMFCLFQDKNIHMNKMLQDMFLESVKCHLSVENSLDIFTRSKELEKQLKFQKDKMELHDSEEFVAELLSVCKKFVQRNIMQLQRTKQWKNLESVIKEELKSNSGFIEIKSVDAKNLKLRSNDQN